MPKYNGHEPTTDSSLFSLAFQDRAFENDINAKIPKFVCPPLPSAAPSTFRMYRLVKVSTTI